MKKKQPELTQEQLENNCLINTLKDLRNDFIPDPPSYISFKVGDRVQYGHWEHSVVTEVLDNNKIYKIHTTTTKFQYGRPVDMEVNTYLSWLDLGTYRSVEEQKLIRKFSEDENSSIQLNFSQRDISAVFSSFYNFGVDMNPDYQRGNVWTQDDKIKLIESIFLNVDIGKFVFISLPFKHLSPSFEILDGKQRIITITEFYENRWKYKGHYFNDLSMRDQHHFEGHPIAWATVRNEDIKLSEKYKYFLRLNTGGKLQDPQHIKYVEELYRKALENERKT